MKMAGRQGNARTTVQNLEVVQVLGEQHVLLLKGAVPGPRGGFVTIHKKK